MRALSLLAFTLLFPFTAQAADCPDFLNHDLRKLHSSELVNLCDVADGKPMLVVNTASHCGYTDQFEGLEATHKQYRDKGLVVVGFASDDFNQEADSEAEAAGVCFKNFGVTFTMIAPTSVTGGDANPVFRALNQQSSAPGWNFFKYVVNAQGEVVERFPSRVAPDDERLRNRLDEVVASY